MANEVDPLFDMTPMQNFAGSQDFSTVKILKITEVSSCFRFVSQMVTPRQDSALGSQLAA